MTEYDSDSETDAERTDRLATAANPHGFISRSGGDAWGTSETPPQAEQAAAPVEPSWGSVGQGVGLNEDTRHPLDLSRLNDHQYFLANRQAFLDAAARGELTNP